MTRLLVSGARDIEDFTTRQNIWDLLDKLNSNLNVRVLIHGDARGLDTIAKDWAYQNNISERAFPYLSEFGKRGGPLRNQQMIDEGAPDIAAVFPSVNSRGTWDMVKRLKKHNIPYYLYEFG